MRRVVLIVLFFAIARGTQAQFFTPVTADRLDSKLLMADGTKSIKGAFLIRPEFTVAGNVLKFLYVDGKFDSFKSTFATRVGMGVSYSLYKLVNDEPYNLYSFAAQISLATTERPNAGILLSASAFDLAGLSPSIGIGYDIVKNSPFKQNLFLMWGIARTF